MSYLHLLQSNPHIGHLPQEELQYLLDHGSVEEAASGGFIFSRGEPADDLLILLEGRVRVYVLQRDAQREVSVLAPGEITGLLPYSRMTHAQGFAQATEPSKVLRLHRDHFREMIVNHHPLTEALVHLMSSRIRSFTTINLQNEKLLSLGKLSAGLAHELNNPASAMVRSSSALMAHLKLVPDAFKSIMNMRVSTEQVEQVAEWLFDILNREKKTFTMLERSALEEHLADVLDEHGFKGAYEVAEELADFGVTETDLNALMAITGQAAFIPTLKWITDNLTTDKVVTEINQSATRIAELIQSIKRYSYMDQNKDRQEVNVNEGLRSTLQLLRHRTKSGHFRVVEELEAEIPAISAFPGELNQVWTNLIDNAFDAMQAQGGTLTVSSCYCAPNVEVRIADTGEGIPEEVRDKIFDPFFTTKPIGKGTGLGLDIVSKILMQLGAIITVASRPGHTEFLIKFPVTPTE